MRRKCRQWVLWRRKHSECILEFFAEGGIEGRAVRVPAAYILAVGRAGRDR